MTVRSISTEGELNTAIVAAVQPEVNGADGLLEALLTALKRPQEEPVTSANDLMRRLAGLTTDGEAANTGKRCSLWKKLQDHLGRRVLTVWCVCHRSDLALESVEDMVPELKHWRSDLVAVATYFHTS